MQGVEMRPQKQAHLLPSCSVMDAMVTGGCRQQWRNSRTYIEPVLEPQAHA